MQSPLSPAYVLHSRPYRDSSALVDLLTLHHGLQRVVWRGARGQRRKLAPQPFMPLMVGMLGRGELKTLTQAEISGGFLQLQGEMLFSGLYLNELLVRLLGAGDSQPLLFAAYQGALEALASNQPVEPVLRRFEWQLLAILGYGFSLTEDASGLPVREQQRYVWHATEGLQPVHDPLTIDAGLPGQALLAMAADDWTDAITLRAAKQLMRQALGVHLGDRPLVSRQLFARQPRKGDEQ
ncbi:DNA replication and repair protein RecO [Halopseudomonas litoralis]|uniref:DNA repair protein RecO n=1 Tax=Halopseudomonas litoralis TaxID=797277 RepID=A0A1H1LYR1_9GAMM|nr:DNA repair protein RecO [Halopseudomonas litoralis]SDR79520.1 DNA replication and repair protein RecO [Halopseudomonas litoralis]